MPCCPVVDLRPHPLGLAVQCTATEELKPPDKTTALRICPLDMSQICRGPTEFQELYTHSHHLQKAMRNVAYHGLGQIFH